MSYIRYLGLGLIGLISVTGVSILVNKHKYDTMINDLRNYTRETTTRSLQARRQRAEELKNRIKSIGENNK